MLYRLKSDLPIDDLLDGTWPDAGTDRPPNSNPAPPKQEPNANSEAGAKPGADSIKKPAKSQESSQIKVNPTQIPVSDLGPTNPTKSQQTRPTNPAIRQPGPRRSPPKPNGNRSSGIPPITPIIPAQPNPLPIGKRKKGQSHINAEVLDRLAGFMEMITAWPEDCVSNAPGRFSSTTDGHK